VRPFSTEHKPSGIVGSYPVPLASGWPGPVRRPAACAGSAWRTIPAGMGRRRLRFAPPTPALIERPRQARLCQGGEPPLRGGTPPNKWRRGNLRSCQTGQGALTGVGGCVTLGRLNAASLRSSSSVLFHPLGKSALQGVEGFVYRLVVSTAFPDHASLIQRPDQRGIVMISPQFYPTL
jgi:hypothetical protein